MFAPLRRSTLRAAALVLTSAAVLLAPAAALAASGDIDPGYGSATGRAIPNGSTGGVVRDSLKLADGSHIVVGSVDAGSGLTDAFVAKLTAAGALDATFGGGDGYITWDFDDIDIARDVTLRPGGGFVVSGDGSNVSQVYIGFIIKLDAVGSPDVTWGTLGTYTNGLAQEIVAAEEIGSGDVVFAGNNRDNGTAVLGTTDGSPALPTYAGGGETDTLADFCGDSFLTGLRILGPNSYVAFGTTRRTALTLTTFGACIGNPPAGPEGSGEVIALTFDNTITAATIDRIPFSTPSFTANDTSLADGTTIVAGATTTTYGGALRATTWRISSAGQFVPGSQTALPATGDWIATDVAQLADGDTYVTGNLGTSQVRTIRLNADGTLDPAWGLGGIADRAYGGTARSWSIQLDAQNRPIIFGKVGAPATAARLELFSYSATQLGVITHSPDFNVRLQDVTIKFPVTNNGPDATDVVVDIDVPTWVEGATYSSTHGGTTAAVADGTGVTWTVPQLAAGATAVLTLTGKPGESGTLTVRSSITSQSSVRTGAAPEPQTHSITVYGAATPRADRIIGTPQRDIIDALAGDDIVFGLGGNDSLFGSDGNDAIDAGAGNDFVRGGNGNDKLNGNTGADRLLGDAGADYLSGAAGNDAMAGGTGNDRMFGGAGDDALAGQQGADFLSGGPGRDKLHGDGGPDTIFGGTDGDWLYGGDSNDKLFGEKGNDWIRGYLGNDLLVGGTGNDLLNGGAGRDRFQAGAGFDIIRADDGRSGDVVDCGNGWDLVYANVGDSIASNCEYVKYDVPAGTPRSKR